MAYTGYQPSEWQKKYHGLIHNEALGAGAGGPGKSYCLWHEAKAYIAIENKRCNLPEGHPHRLRPGTSVCRILYLRRTYPMLQEAQIKMQEIFETIDPDVKWVSEKHWFDFPSGLKVRLGHCHKPNDWMQFYSDEYTVILFDELCQFEREQYEQIKSRLRSSDPLLRKMLKVRSMSNPVTNAEELGDIVLKDPYWVRKYFVDPCREGNKTIKKKLKMIDGSIEYHTRIYLPAKLSDNPDKEFVREYEKTLQAAQPHIRQAILFGDWYYVRGAFFEDVWNPLKHIKKPFAIPEDWALFRSLDWGYRKQGVVGYYAVDPENNLYMIAELNFKLKDAAEVARDIIRPFEQRMGLWSTKAKEGGHSLMPAGVADTQLWEDRGDVGKTKAEEMAALGVNWQKADKKFRKRNAEHIQARLKATDDPTAKHGSLYLFSNCDMTIRTVPSIPTSKTDSECPADGGEDHWFDQLAYAAAFASRDRSGLIPNRDVDDKDDDDDDQIEKGRGQYGYGSEVC